MARDTRTEKDEQMMTEWLKKNKVTVCPPFARTDPDQLEYKRKWGGGPKKKKTQDSSPK